MRPNRDQLGLLLARAWSLRSTCARRRVGCVLMDSYGYQLSAGYNGVPSKMEHCVTVPCPGVGAASGTALDLCLAVHAEQNALTMAPDPRLVYTAYVTASPCVHCVKMLLNTSCFRIVFEDEYPHPEARRLWEGRGREWIKLSRAHVLVPSDRSAYDLEGVI